jgi:hypothetical protein
VAPRGPQISEIFLLRVTLSRDLGDFSRFACPRAVVLAGWHVTSLSRDKV